MIHENILAICFGILFCVVSTIEFFHHRNKSKGNVLKSDKTFRKYQVSFIVCYCSCMVADWIQAPYCYTLLESYHFSETIGAPNYLYAIQYFCTSISALIIPYVARWIGRRRLCIIYCIMFSTAAGLVLIENLICVIVSRILHGFSTMILYTVLDAWMVASHYARGYDPEWLGSTYYLMASCNSITAIIASCIAWGLEWLTGSYGSPNYVAIAFLLVSMVLIFFRWENNPLENDVVFDGKLALNALEDIITSCPPGHPNRIILEGKRRPPPSGLKHIFSYLTDKRILLVGLVQVTFEFNIFAHVFAYTPAVDDGTDIGCLFVAFMFAQGVGAHIGPFATQYLSLSRASMLEDIFLLKWLGIDGKSAFRSSQEDMKILETRKRDQESGSLSKSDLTTKLELLTHSPSTIRTDYSSSHGIIPLGETRESNKIPAFLLCVFVYLIASGSQMLGAFANGFLQKLGLCLCDLAAGSHYAVLGSIRALEYPEDGRVTLMSAYSSPSFMLNAVSFIVLSSSKDSVKWTQFLGGVAAFCSSILALILYFLAKKEKIQEIDFKSCRGLKNSHNYAIQNDSFVSNKSKINGIITPTNNKLQPFFGDSYIEMDANSVEGK